MTLFPTGVLSAAFEGICTSKICIGVRTPLGPNQAELYSFMVFGNLYIYIMSSGTKQLLRCSSRTLDSQHLNVYLLCLVVCRDDRTAPRFFVSITRRADSWLDSRVKLNLGSLVWKSVWKNSEMYIPTSPNDYLYFIDI